MYQTYYLLEQIPDLSLSKYSSLDDGGVEGVLKHHGNFWRQMHRRGICSQSWRAEQEAVEEEDSFHLFYEYDPQRPEGRKLQIGLRFDTRLSPEESFIEQTIKASSLGAFYELKRYDPAAPGKMLPLHTDRTYAYNAHIVKKEAFTKPLHQTDVTRYYTTSEWEMNEEGRLFNMMKLMAQIDRPCLYCVSIYPRDLRREMEERMNNILPQLRQAVRMQINARGSSVGIRQKDENADDTLDFYTDLLEALAENPHFLVDVQVLSDDPAHAAYILDAAASEALDKGAHELRTWACGLSLSQLPFRGNQYPMWRWSHADAPRMLTDLPHLYMLEELVPFAMLPALYPGEYIELPKESAPAPVEHGLLLGKDLESHKVNFPLKNLSKHAFLAGVPGSGKTNSMMHLITAMHVTYKIPVLILEPAKHEYRLLTGVKGMEDLELFSPGAFTKFPLHINPFEFPQNMTLAEHIRNLLTVFDGAFSLEPPMPFLLDSSVEEVYRDHNWVPQMINSGSLQYPTMSELYSKLEKKLETTDYSDEIKGNLKSALQVRIGSLLTREMGDIFDVQRSSVPPNEWIRRSAIIELESMGKDQANFTTLLISTLIRETLKIENFEKSEDGRPRHVMFFEEAHNLIGTTAEPKGEGEADPKTAATAFVVKMLAEVRALGEGIVIADQLPTAMAPEVIKNTSLKIALRITAQDDRGLIGSTMNANPDQLEKLSIFNPGHALISYEPLLKPFEVQIPYFEAKEGEQNEEAILLGMSDMTAYVGDISCSMDISCEKWLARDTALRNRFDALKKEHAVLVENIRKHDEAGEETASRSGTALSRERDRLFNLSGNLWIDVSKLVIDIRAYGSQFSYLLLDSVDLDETSIRIARRVRKYPLGKTMRARFEERLNSAKLLYKEVKEYCTKEHSGLFRMSQEWIDNYIEKQRLLLRQRQR